MTTNSYAYEPRPAIVERFVARAEALELTAEDLAPLCTAVERLTNPRGELIGPIEKFNATINIHPKVQLDYLTSSLGIAGVEKLLSEIEVDHAQA